VAPPPLLPPATAASHLRCRLQLAPPAPSRDGRSPPATSSRRRLQLAANRASLVVPTRCGLPRRHPPPRSPPGALPRWMEAASTCGVRRHRARRRPPPLPRPASTSTRKYRGRRRSRILGCMEPSSRAAAMSSSSLGASGALGSLRIAHRVAEKVMDERHHYPGN
jgi:hypothetical protein